MTPLIFRCLVAGGWSIFFVLCYFLWPDLVRVGYAIAPVEPVDATIIGLLLLALLGVVVQAVVGDKLVVANPVPKRGTAKFPKQGATSAAVRPERKAPDSTSRSSQRLAAVQARFEGGKAGSEEDELAGIDTNMTTVRELEKSGKLSQALALANRKGDKVSAARLHMKLGQYLHALDIYVDLEDFEGAAMAATLKGDLSMGRAFWRQAALSLQNAGAANPNMLGGLWDRAGNAAAAATSYEAGGMFHKATECFEIAGDTKSAERCRQKKALQTATEETILVNPEDAKESSRYLSEKGDLFGAAEALLEGKLHAEAARLFERCGDLARAARYYEVAGETDLAEALRAKLIRQGEVSAATGGTPPPMPAAPSSPSSPLEPPPDESTTPSKEELKSMQPPVRPRAGVIAMQSAGLEIPSDLDPRPTDMQSNTTGLPEGIEPNDPATDTASRLAIKKRQPTESDLAATTVRNRPRPAGAVKSLDMATVDLSQAVTQVPASGRSSSSSASGPGSIPPAPRAPFVPFPGELPTPSDVFSSPPPLPWKPGWPLVAPEPRSIGVPLFASMTAGEAVLVHPPAFALLSGLSDEPGDGVETYRPSAVTSRDTTEAMMRVQTLAGEGRFREAAEIAAAIEAWAAAATLLNNGRFWAEAADLWRRLGQWSDAVDALLRLDRYEDAALLYLAAGRVSRAVAVLRRGMRRNPGNKEQLAALTGRILVMAGRVDLAVRLLRLVVAPSGPGSDSAVAVYRLGRILEDHEAFAEAHGIYVALMEAGARNDDLREREQNLARELGVARYLPPDSARIVGDVEMTAFDAMVTRVDSPTDFPTLIDGRPATFQDLNADQALEWVMRSQSAVRQRGVVRPRIMAQPFPLTLPEDLSDKPQPAKDATAARVASSHLSLSLFGAPLAPAEPWTQAWRFSIKESRSSLGGENLYLAEDAMLKETIALRVFGRGSGQARGLAWVADRIRSLAAIGQPNIVPVLDMGVADLRPYLVERYYPTGSLAERLQIGGALPFVAALRIFVQIGRGLEAAGRIGLVHGHIHPGQVLFGHGGEALLSSWGVEIIRKGPDILESFPKGPASARPDIRALGLLAYMSIAGHPPADRNPLPLHGVRPDVPEAFGQIVEWCIGLDPKRRYHAVGEFLPAAEQLLTAM